jgi:hypothetical protein
MKSRLICWLWCVLMTCCACAAADADPIEVGDYALDGRPRELERGQTAPCFPEGLVSYSGELVPYDKPAQVHRAFRSHLRQFEQLLKSTAQEFYGRAPARILHMGSYRCRENERARRLLSEHALGNAIDIAGFAFDAVAARDLPRGTPEPLKRAFSVRVDRHWKGGDAIADLHRNFLRTLAERVIAQPDMFRVVLGPAYPRHQNHFHFDNAPYRLVQVF